MFSHIFAILCIGTSCHQIRLVSYHHTTAIIINWGTDYFKIKKIYLMKFERSTLQLNISLKFHRNSTIMVSKFKLIYAKILILNIKQETFIQWVIEYQFCFSEHPVGSQDPVENNSMCNFKNSLS